MQKDYFEATPEQIAEYLRRVRGEEEAPPPPSEPEREEKPPVEEEKPYVVEERPPEIEQRPLVEEEKPPTLRVEERKTVVEEKFPTVEVETPVTGVYRVTEEIHLPAKRKRLKFTPQMARQGVIFSVILGKPKGLEDW